MDAYPKINGGAHMAATLTGRRIAILATDGVEQSELTSPWKAATAAGATVDLISPKPGQIQAKEHGEKANRFDVTRTLDQVSADTYDGLILPGGVANPDKLRTDPHAVSFVRSFVEAGKPIASICHGPWMLVEADAVRGKTLTSWPSLQTDIRNAGGHWVDEPVHVDQGIVTSRKPDDLPQFNAKMLEEFAEGVHARQFASAGTGSSGR
jgi:protease I